MKTDLITKVLEADNLATPRTDAVVQDDWTVKPEDCEKIERELGEINRTLARSLQKAMDALDGLLNYRDDGEGVECQRAHTNAETTLSEIQSEIGLEK